MKKRITLEEARKQKPSKEDIERFKSFEEDFSDPECPLTSEEDFENFRFVRDAHPEWFKPKKKAITIRLDIDIIEKYKSMGKGYQTKMNDDLRKAAGLD